MTSRSGIGGAAQPGSHRSNLARWLLGAVILLFDDHEGGVYGASLPLIQQRRD